MPSATDVYTNRDADHGIKEVPPAGLGEAGFTTEDVGVGVKDGARAPPAAVGGVGGDANNIIMDEDGGGKLAPDELPAPTMDGLIAAAGSINTNAMVYGAGAAITMAAATANFQFGIPESTIMSAVPPQPKKKRKTQDEFTITQKIDILDELKGSNPPTVPDLAAKHNTSRTSIYRWKKDLPRLMKLAKKEGKGQYKRVGSKRKMYNDEYTAAEKLAVVRELKGEGAPSVRTLAERLSTNHRSIYRWKKDEARLIKLVEQEGKGNAKRIGDDPLLRVKEALKVFHASVYGGEGGQPATPGTVPLTGTVLATKAKQIRDEMLAQHEITPFLTEDEVKGMKEFTSSTSWGRKILVKCGWKTGETKPPAAATGGAGFADGAIEEGGIKMEDGGVDNSITILPRGSNPIVPTLPLMDRPARKVPPPTAAALKKAQKITEIKKELAVMRKKLNSSEARNRELETQKKKLEKENALIRANAITGKKLLENENRQLKLQIEALMNGNAEAVAAGMPPLGEDAEMVNAIAAAKVVMDAAKKETAGAVEKEENMEL